MDHSSGTKSFTKALELSLILTVVFFAIEVAGGIISGSLALLSDAGHMFRDIFALLVSLSALKISSRLPTKGKTFGFHRVEIFAALLNGIILAAVGLWILIEAVRRIGSPRPVQSTTMLIVALAGLGINLYAAFKLHGSHDLNVRSAFYHVISDAAFSLGVVAAAILIALTGRTIIDLILSAVMSPVIIFSAVNVVREAVVILLEFTPKGLDFDEVVGEIQKAEGVQGVHNVHLWSLCSNINVIDAHIFTRETDLVRIEKIKREIKDRLVKFDIKHATLEFECEECVLPDEIRKIEH